MCYYCIECKRQTYTQEIEDSIPYEAWGDRGFHTYTFLICGMCGSDQIEPLDIMPVIC